MGFEELSQTDAFKILFPDPDSIVCKMVIANKKHVLTHRILYADFYQVELKKEPNSLGSFKQILISALDDYPIHRLMEIYLEKRLL